jgi:transcriptional regulator with XRE-family HTH domain
MSIAEQIRVLCARLNISQAELARRLGQSPQGFSAKMRRESFTVDELNQIADAAGVVFDHKFAFTNGEKI